MVANLLLKQSTQNQLGRPRLSLTDPTGSCKGDRGVNENCKESDASPRRTSRQGSKSSPATPDF
eukprot:7095719-Pyramimonas_sp.AAC.1